MTRRSPEVVDGALGFQERDDPYDASYGWEALDILAEEVRALREELRAEQRLCASYRKGAEESGKRWNAIDDYDATKATIARVEALVEGYEAHLEACPNDDNYPTVVAELKAALKGGA